MSHLNVFSGAGLGAGCNAGPTLTIVSLFSSLPTSFSKHSLIFIFVILSILFFDKGFSTKRTGRKTLSLFILGISSCKVNSFLSFGTGLFMTSLGIGLGLEIISLGMGELTKALPGLVFFCG